MSSRTIKLIWKDDRQINLHMLDNPVADYYWHCAKHLQNLELKFNVRSNPFHPCFYNTDKLIGQFIDVAQQLNVDVKSDQLSQQQYLNQLHATYFTNADNNTFEHNWLLFHDLLHALESSQGYNLRNRDIWIDFEHYAGPLIKRFDRKLLRYATLQRQAGTCYITAHELGKDPLTYFNDGEPSDVDVICKLMKPWVDLKPVLNISTEDYSYQIDSADLLHKFLDWFDPYKKFWCDHWNLQGWSPDEISVAIPVAVIDNLHELVDRFQHEDYPVRISR